MTTEPRAWTPRSANEDIGPRDARGRRAAVVSAELESIFPGAPAPAMRRVRARVRSLIPRPAGATSARAAGLGAVIAVGLMGLSAGAMLMNVSQFASPAAGRAPAPAADVQLAVAELRSGLPALGALEPVVAMPPSAPAAVFAPPRSQRASAPPAHRRAAHRSEIQRVHVQRAHAAARPQPAILASCRSAPSSERAWCEHGLVMAADQRLRRAYGGAVRAGVSRPMLASYRDRWSGLRSRASWDPQGVASGYDAMAREISRETDRTLARDDRPRSARAARTGRLLPLWL